MGSSFSADKIPDQTGKVVIITGGTAGLGLASAVELVKKGAYVIITARSESRGQEAIKAIKEAVGPQSSSGKIEFGIADQEDLQSVRAFADWFIAKNLPLHVLLLNAGVAFIAYKVIEGVESHLFINHVSHHYLTHLLLHKLKASAPSRVVVLSSDAHKFVSKLVFDAPPPETFNRVTSYGVSKLANIHFTKALQKRLAQEDIYVNAVHPGSVATHITSKWAFAAWINPIIIFLFNLICTSVSNGALTQLYAATSPEVEARKIRGQYLYPTAKVRARLAAYAEDAAAAEQLWEWTEKKIQQVLQSTDKKKT